MTNTVATPLCQLGLIKDLLTTRLSSSSSSSSPRGLAFFAKYQYLPHPPPTGHCDPLHNRHGPHFILSDDIFISTNTRPSVKHLFNTLPPRALLVCRSALQVCLCGLSIARTVLLSDSQRGLTIDPEGCDAVHKIVRVLFSLTAHLILKIYYRCVQNSK